MIRQAFFTLFLCFIFNAYLNAQQIVVQPYLQDAEPDKMVIMWETDSNSESTVEWGTDESLGQTTTGTVIEGNQGSQLHTVILNDLDPDTRYFYKTVTGAAESAIFDFVTPATADAEKSFNMVAMSDMQQYSQDPNQFHEIVNEGILEYLQDNFDEDLAANLAFVLIPGDLVDNGNSYNQWANTFFTPASLLFNKVPVYPAIGNHENDAAAYFKYFHLPENGTPGFEEHWWLKDYSNVRILGFDTNGGYRVDEQLSWLDSVLMATCNNPDIDFVFAQMHHPFKSELWTPGETDYSGEIIQRLEDFTTACGKPSIHFFGHTHGYSRGQSRDHNHLWVNVATAGGRIDGWGEFPQADYEEFNISQDEYGYVFLEVEAGNDPQFTLKRLSLGDIQNEKDNSLEDLVNIRLNNDGPDQPIGLFPAEGAVIYPDCFVLKASEYTDVDGDEHGAAHWQISADCNFENLIVDQWRQYENWYYDVDTQAEDDLTDEKVQNLEPNTDYCWRVRYRDRALGWSEWSEPISFSTGVSNVSENLLVNAGAEDDLSEWTTITGIAEALEAEVCEGINPHSGLKYFAIGGLCEESAYAEVVQEVDVQEFSMEIDEGLIEAFFGGYMSDYSGSDVSSIFLHFYNENDDLINVTDTISNSIASWTYYGENREIPVGTRKINFYMTGTRNAGTDNDSYFDDMFLKMRFGADSCAEMTVTDVFQPIKENASIIRIYPNPVGSVSKVELPFEGYGNLNLIIRNSQGMQVAGYSRVQPPVFDLKKGDLPSGIYSLEVLSGSKLIGTGRFSVK